MERISLSVLSCFWFNSQPWWSTSRDYSRLITCTALYTGLGGPKATTTGEVMPLEKPHSYKGDNKMPVHQAGLRQVENLSKLMLNAKK